MPYCTNCGEELSPGEKRCPSCDELLDLGYDNESEPILSGGSTHAFYAGAALGILALLLSAAASTILLIVVSIIAAFIAGILIYLDYKGVNYQSVQSQGSPVADEADPVRIIVWGYEIVLGWWLLVMWIFIPFDMGVAFPAPPQFLFGPPIGWFFGTLIGFRQHIVFFILPSMIIVLGLYWYRRREILS